MPPMLPKLAFQMGRSFFAEMQGERVGPSFLHVWDDPYLHRGVESRGVDDEGVAPQKFPLIENGMLKKSVL